MNNRKFKNKVESTFRALKYKNYKLFFYGQCISLIGTWIQQIALNWLVYRLTHSALMMGVTVFAVTIPSLFLSPFLGVIVDRVNKYRALIITQTIFMILAGVLGILTITNTVQIWHIVVLGVLMGITNTFDMPLRQAFVVNLVEDTQDLSNAISLNSTIFNLARLIGPAIGGILIANVGEGLCFILNAISYIAVIYAFFAMKIKSIAAYKTDGNNMLKELSEGIKYAFNNKPIRITLIYLAISSLFGMFYPLLMPIYVKEILHGGAQTLGFLMSASGVGALLGALYLAGRKNVKGLEKWICIASVLFGVGLLGLNFTNKTLIALLLLFITGYGMVIIIAACNTLTQHFVDNDKRGRIMSLYSMAFMGTAPLGSLCSGAIAEKIGVPHTFFISGVTMLFAAYLFYRNIKHFRYENI